MEKSSSSLKRKPSKKLSKAKLSSRIKKSKKNKSKKVHRREVSLSSYDSDDSRSLDTSASSSSEDSYRRKRDRSRTRKHVKGRKRKAQERSYNRDSSEDSHYVRKKKKVKRKHERDEVRKKPLKKKNIRREASVDLMSDTSQSCSTCSDDNRYKKQRGRSERKEKDRKLRRSGSERSSRYRARSSSSCSSENSYEATKEKYAGEKNSRQLRSVITVTKTAEECEDLFRNETREEIANDLDYPCGSDDNNNGGSRRQLDLHVHLASEEKLSVDNEAGDMNVDLNFVEPGHKDRSCNENSNLKSHRSGTSESAKETSETFDANVNDDDLEKILRQRALENLRKFRSEMQSSAKAPDEKNKIISQVKQPIADKLELVQGKSVVNNAVVGTEFDKQTPGEETNLFVGSRSLVACLRDNEVILDSNKDISTSAKCDLASAPEKVIDHHSGTITESNNFNATNIELTKQTQNPCLDSFQTPASHESTNAKLLVTEGHVENAVKIPQAAIQSSNNIRGADVSSVENKSNKLQVESNQDSQFEKKTMNVMRDGEMVQVSYKVYIPKKVPALARRQLKR